MQLILEPGFSTAGAITQQAGRGVGMDVVATEIKKLGGALHMETKPGEGTRFTIRLPFTLAISHALSCAPARSTTRCRCRPSRACVRLSRDGSRGSTWAATRRLRLRRPEVPLPAPGDVRRPRRRPRCPDRT